MYYKMTDRIKTVLAVAPLSVSATALTPTAVDASGGYDRCTIKLATGAFGSGSQFKFEVTESNATGGTYTLISGSTITQVTAGNGAAKVFVVDVPVNAAKPFLKVRGTTFTSTVVLSAVADLYRGTRTFPPSSTHLGQLIVV